MSKLVFWKLAIGLVVYWMPQTITHSVVMCYISHITLTHKY